jgi:hypothetical protein
MPARFRIFDHPEGGADRYFIVDSRPYSHSYPRGPWRGAVSMNSQPYHPSYGIGLHIEMDARDWANAVSKRFRNWGKRVYLDDLPPETAHCCISFVRDCFDESDPRHKTLSEFLQTSGRTPHIVSQACCTPSAAKIIRTLLKES